MSKVLTTPGLQKLIELTQNDLLAKSAVVTSVSSASTNSQVPSAKLFYDTCGDIESLINAL